MRRKSHDGSNEVHLLRLCSPGGAPHVLIKRSARGLVVHLRTGGPPVDGWSTSGRVVRLRTGSPPVDGWSTCGRVVRLRTGSPPMEWWSDLGPAVRLRTVGPLQTGGPTTHQLGQRYASHGSQGGTPSVKVKEVYLQGQSRRYAPCAGQGGIPRAAMKEAHLL